jgi:uncharacterized protein (DUF305 family)
MRKFLTLALLLMLSACSSSTDSAFSANDQMFAAMMVPHHEQAVEMSDIALSNSTNPAILEIATEIKAAQQPEIDQMLSWGGDVMGSHAGHTMDGMLTKAEITELKQATGVTFDRLFLAGMIKHHEGAIEMAKMVINSKNPEAAALGKAITVSQQAEIVQMQKLLATLGN